MIPVAPIRKKTPSQVSNLKVGDYIEVKFESRRDAALAQMRFLNHALMHNMVFTTRRTKDHTLQVWRTE